MRFSGQDLFIASLGFGTMVFGLSGCGGPTAFTKGEYDDPTRVELLDDKFNEADMQQMAETTVNGLSTCDSVIRAQRPPVVIVEKIQNRTEEHIDTSALNEKVRTALIKSGKLRFIDKEARETLDSEYNYNANGNVSTDSQKKRGKQVGADYILNGAISTNIQQVGNVEFIYYKLNMNLTNLETSTIDCVAEKEVRKKFRKHSVGL